MSFTFCLEEGVSEGRESEPNTLKTLNKKGIDALGK
jgi:hypothetical protein